MIDPGADIHAMAYSPEAADAAVDDYLAGRLSEAQARAFEHYCLENPAFAKRVQLGLSTRQGILALESPARPATLRQSRWPWAMAASLAALAVGAWIMLHPQGHEFLVYRSWNDVPASYHAGTVSHLTLVATRGGDDGAADTLPSGVVQLRVFPTQTSGDGNYSVALESDGVAGHRSAWISSMSADAQGALQLFVPVAQAGEQNWTIRVAASGSKEAESFQVRLKVPGSDQR